MLGSRAPPCKFPVTNASRALIPGAAARSVVAMSDPRRRSILPTVVALLAVASLAAGGVAWWRSMRPVAPPAAERPAFDVPEAAPPTADDTALVASDDVIERALGALSPADSAALRNRRVEEVKGVDVSMLTPPQLATFIAFANAERCTCGCGFTLAACRTYDPSCEISLPIAIALRDSIVAAAAKRPSGGR